MIPDLHVRIEGRAGRITLNRPAALNALTLPMVRALMAALHRWADAPEVAIVLIDAAGPRAFCAGGDVAQIYHEGMAGNLNFARQFWREEYVMNDTIARFAKPVVAFVHGFCMGGGVGIACHARHRIVGESARLAMPECGIGLVPDVGGSALLAAAPPGLGAYLALTGARMEPATAVEAGFADHFIPEHCWPQLLAELAMSADTSILTKHAVTAPLPVAPLPDKPLRQAFSSFALPDIYDAVRTQSTAIAGQALAAMDKASPLALAMALEIQRRLDRPPELRAALQLEYRAVQGCLRSGDLFEGVRARLIDRGHTPRWSHVGITDVPNSDVEAMLAPIAGDGLLFAGHSSGPPA